VDAQLFLGNLKARVCYFGLLALDGLDREYLLTVYQFEWWSEFVLADN